ncbi:response regulator [Shewanella waksmanii]|uniref:winged helix-turn-helix domain-containing protein n=1 Tax=Shewanella waksmanii TaxID=213783 RepID=UPI0037369112
MLVEFEQFSIDCELRQLVINGQVVNADDRLFVLMALLIEHAPQWASKQQCIDKCWPDTVVTDLSLSKLVSQVRKVFKQAGCDAMVIQTVHGRGFRLADELALQLNGANQQTLNQVNRFKRWTLPYQRFLKRNIILVAGLVAALGLLVNQFFIQPDLIHNESSGSIGRILWVDDNPNNNESERQFFSEKGLTVYSVVSSDEALQLMKMYQYDVVISDMGRHGDPLAGMKLLQQLRQQNNVTPFYLYTIAASPGLTELLSTNGGQGAAVTSAELYQFVMAHFYGQI